MTLKSNNFKRTKYTCYYTYVSMSSVFSLPPMLFLTFREMYGISYTLLGTLVAVNFCTQLTVDLIFTFLSKYFDLKKTARIMPLLTSFGLVIYAVIPNLFPQYAYLGLLLGTVLFSIAAGLCEVIISPLVAAIPSNNPERVMSRLHSLYAYGVLSVIVISTLFFSIFGRENWIYLTLFLAVLPILSSILFAISPMPELNLSNSNSMGDLKQKNFGMALCILCIFLGSAAENAMTNWISGYMENALKIPKTVGDIVGMASFAVVLGLTRTAYAKYGKNIYSVLLLSMIGSIVCYLVAGLSSNAIISMSACILIGLCTSMLWPGMLIYMKEKFPYASVAMYALMAAGGDLGAAISPQLLGIVVDKVTVTNLAVKIGEKFSLAPEQVGMKAGVLVITIFPVLGVALLIYMKKYFKKHNTLN